MSEINPNSEYYVEKNWENGDLITVDAMNKIEKALASVKNFNLWDQNVSYQLGDYCFWHHNKIYRSKANTNEGHEPVEDLSSADEPVEYSDNYWQEVSLNDALKLLFYSPTPDAIRNNTQAQLLLGEEPDANNAEPNTIIGIHKTYDEVTIANMPEYDVLDLEHPYKYKIGNLITLCFKITDSQHPQNSRNQIYIDYYGGIYTRSNNGNDWSDWKKIATQNDINTLYVDIRANQGWIDILNAQQGANSISINNLQDDVYLNKEDSIILYKEGTIWNQIVPMNGEYGENKRWNFSNASETEHEGRFYGIYEITEGTDIVAINGHHFNNDHAAYGFYDGLPTDASSNLIYSFKYNQNNITMSSIYGIPKIPIKVPHGASYLVVNIGADKINRGVWNYALGQPGKKITTEDSNCSSAAYRWNFVTHQPTQTPEDAECYHLKYNIPANVKTLFVYGYRVGSGRLAYGFYSDTTPTENTFICGSPTTEDNDICMMRPVHVPTGAQLLIVNVAKDINRRGIWEFEPLKNYDKVRKETNYEDYYQDAYEEDVLKCAASYLVHQVNNTQITFPENFTTEKRRFISKYSTISWLYLRNAAKAYDFQIRSKRTYDTTTTPPSVKPVVETQSGANTYNVFYSHCTPFALLLTSCIPYEESPYANLFGTGRNMPVEYCYRCSLEEGTIAEKPYTADYPNLFGVGKITYVNAKSGLGVTKVATKVKINETVHWVFNEEVLKCMRTGDFLHISRMTDSNVASNYLHHGHSMIYIRTIKEIKDAVKKYYPGCQLTNWYKNNTDDGKYGYVVEVTNENAQGNDSIRVSDLVAALSRSNNSTDLYVTYMKSTKDNSTKAMREFNNALPIGFIHQPYTVASVTKNINQRSGVLASVLPTKTGVSYEWQCKPAESDQWQPIIRLIQGEQGQEDTYVKITGSYYQENVGDDTPGSEPGALYRCKVVDLVQNQITYSQEKKYDNYLIPDITSSEDGGNITLTVGYSNDLDVSVYWQIYQDDILIDNSSEGKRQFVNYQDTPSKSITLTKANYLGREFVAKVELPFDSGYYITPTFIIQ